MCDVVETDIPAVIDEDFNAAEYSKKVIKMFDDDLPVTQISLLCENTLMPNVVDRFGEDVETETINEEMFRAKVNVVPSSTFFGWVMQYQGGILIDAPEQVKNDYELMLSNIVIRQKEIRTHG